MPYVSTLDATVSSANADSYVTLAESLTLAAGLGLASWAALDGAVQDAALRRACREIDAHRFHNGNRYDLSQALAFPRVVDVNSAGAAFIPAAVKIAQTIQAEWIAVGGEADRKQFDGPHVGPLGTSSPLCPAALQVLARYISRAGGYVDGTPQPWWQRYWPF
jgi:hypothetical protein